MPQIVQQGALNTTALIVPDLYVQIVPPQNTLINGVPTNVLGVVGSAQWGPIGQAMIAGSMAQYAQIFGAIQNRKFDMGTAVAVAALQGASNFRCVRASDGTDAKASAAVGSTNITYTALYSGTLGNSATVAISAGSKLGTLRAVVAIPGLTPEVYDNLPGSTTAWAATTAYVVNQVVSNGVNFYVCTAAGTSASSGGPSTTGSGITDGSVTWAFVSTINAFWVALAAAINNGNGALRPPSNLITAAAGAGTTAPTTATVTLTGGADGTTSLTATTLVGSDTSHTGMYALRGQGCSLALLADADSSATWSTQVAFGLSEGVYMIAVAPAGSAIQNGTTGTVDLKQQAGVDSYAMKVLHGDWIYWYDNVNLVTRLVSPQGFAAGRLANLSPEQSGLNKPIYGIIGTQKSGLPGAQNTTYATAELQALIQNGVDVICNPQPGGSYWGLRAGHNTSSNASINGDNYTRMTNYVSKTIAAGMGLYVGQTITSTLFGKIRGTLLNFFSNMLNAGQLGSTDGSLPYSVICDITNNPQSSTGLGYVIANAQVRYLAINEKFLVNLEGGQTVTVLRQGTYLNNSPATPVQ